jgi:hypothetical protein
MRKRESLAPLRSRSAKFSSGREKADHSALYFSHSNAAGQLAREQLAQESLESLIRWLKKEGNVGIMGESRWGWRCSSRQMRRIARNRDETVFAKGYRKNLASSFCSSNRNATILK